jgi:hypothetical protein
MDMMKEFPAYSWQWLREVRLGIKWRAEGGDSKGKWRGCIRTSNNINDEWCGLLAQLHGPVRSVGELEIAYATRLAAADIYIHPRARIRLQRPKQIFGISPLKTRGGPTDELICFPTTALSSLSFFDYPPLAASSFPPPPPPPSCPGMLQDAYVAGNIRERLSENDSYNSS